MPRFDELPADQKAVLQLLLKQGKAYDDIASLLRIEAAAVRERALDALDALGEAVAPGTAGLSAARQDEVSDYLLGQQSASTRADTRTFLQGSAAGRAWARAVAGELRGVAGDALPDVPAERAEVDEAFGALQARGEARERRQRSSKLGGALFLGGVAVCVALLLIVLISRGGNDSNSSNASDTTPAPTTSTTPVNAANPTPEAQFNLNAANGGTAQAAALVFKLSGERVLALQGTGFTPTDNKSFAYAMWLYSSPTKSARLGFVGSGVAKDGKLQTGAAPSQVQDKVAASRLRSQLARLYDYKQVLITRETTADPKQPGTVVASGPITQPKA